MGVIALKTVEISWKLYFGNCELVQLGAISLKTYVLGKPLIIDLIVGPLKACGISFF